LIVGGVLVRFFAFVAPLIVRYYVRRLWLGLPGRARRTDDPRRAAGAGAVAVRANGPSNDHAGLVIHDIAKPPQDDRPRDGGMAFALPADWGLSPHAPAASGGVSSSSFRGHSDLGCVDRQRQAASGAPLRRKGAPFGGDALPILGQALVFASAIGCLFGVLAVLARLV
jgi:hypothetical protein